MATVMQVLWWADGCDNESSRNVLVEEKPYKNGPNEIEYLLYILRKGQTQ